MTTLPSSEALAIVDFGSPKLGAQATSLTHHRMQASEQDQVHQNQLKRQEPLMEPMKLQLLQRGTEKVAGSGDRIRGNLADRNKEKRSRHAKLDRRVENGIRDAKCGWVGLLGYEVVQVPPNDVILSRVK
nr:hypothetical protein Iba_chr11eCG3780 [Ipomoea batatas]